MSKQRRGDQWIEKNLERECKRIPGSSQWIEYRWRPEVIREKLRQAKELMQQGGSPQQVCRKLEIIDLLLKQWERTAAPPRPAAGGQHAVRATSSRQRAVG